jgi:phosphoenolpyruvate phosphomutase
VVPTSYNVITEEELKKAGDSIVIYANHLIRSAYPAMVQTAKTILTHGRSKEVDDVAMPIKEIITLIPGDY